MSSEQPDKDRDVTYATRYMLTEANTIERHYRLKDLSLALAKDMTTAAVLHCKGAFPLATVKASVSARGKVTCTVS